MNEANVCRMCKCTDPTRQGGGHWVKPDLCSKCMKNDVTMDRLKRTAKRIKREENITHMLALDAASRHYGFTNYVNARRTISKRATACAAL